MGDVQDTPRAVTRRLLLELFTPDELRRFIADHWPALEHLLPGGLASSDALADAVVRGLERRGAIGELCARLADEFPRRKEEVEACAARWRTRPVAPEDPDEAAWRRLRTAFAAGHATIHLLGFPHRGSKPAVRLQDACVPLRMRRGESVVAWTVQRLLAHLRLDGDASARNAAGDVGDEGVRPAARVLVLGDPGSGKSTLCQYLTVLLAGGVRRPGLAIPEVVPLHFRLRDVTRRGGSLLQAIRDRAAEFGVDVGVDVLTRACEAGRAVLIVDGLDEVGDVAARIDQRDRLLAFLALHPRVPVIVSSREVGYHEAPLPDHGEGAFLHLEMARLNDEEIAGFVARWYAAIEHDPAARDRGAAELVASIQAAPAVRSLAGNRLLLTLIALIHRQDARLPGERVALFERCVQLFLDTWPALRGASFTAIPPARQRRLLETLAAALLGRKRRSGRDLAMGRKGLLKVLASYWRADEPEAGAIEASIARWVDHLSEVSGLVPEVGPGVHQFVHRSLQEYLAACWYMHATDPAEVLALHHERTIDREVWRMLAGLHAADRGRAEALFQRMTGEGAGAETWSFLLECLGEEADFPPAAVKAILQRALQVAERSPHPSAGEQAIARLWRLSGRHREVVRRWFAQGLGGGSLAELPALVWAAAKAMPVEDAIAGLDGRLDRVQAAAVLAPDLWPRRAEEPARAELDALGRWAWSTLDADAALALFAGRGVAALGLWPAAMMSLQARLSGPVVAALTLQLVIDAADLAEAMRASPGWRGVAAIAVEPGGWILPIVRAPPIRSGGAMAGDRTRQGRAWMYVHGWFPPALGDDGGVEPNAISDRFTGVRLFGYLLGSDDPTPDDFWADACVPYGMDCFDEPDEFGDYEAADPGNDYPLKEFERDVLGDLEPGFAITEVAGGVPLVAPSAEQESGAYDVRRRMIDLRGPGSGEVAADDAGLATVAVGLHALHAGHAAIAARAFAGDREQATRASVLRQQAAWVLQNWHVVEAGSDDADATVLALVLALGWTQCLTTGRWPDSPRWRALLGGAEPTHWWPRMHWHLCWSTARPEDEAHRAAVRAAIVAGRDDPEFAALAGRWSGVFGAT